MASEGRRLDRALCDWFADYAIHDTTIGGLLREQAEKHGESDALLEGLPDGTVGRRWTYSQLLADAERLAKGLSARFRPGERVAVWAPNVPEWVLVEYAAALAGLTLVTVNPSYQKRELAYVLDQSTSVALFLVNEFRGNPMAQIAAEVAEDLPALREIVDLQDEGALFTQPSGTLPEVDTNDPAQIQYTSGTTGFPKGVVLSHRNLTNNARLFIEVGKLPKGLGALGLTPLFHTMGCSMGVLGALQSGGAYCPLLAFDPNAALDIVEAEKMSWTICVPTMAVALVAAQKQKPRDLSSLQRIGIGGAMVAPELARNVRDVLGADTLVAYGQTESSPLITTGRPDDDFERIITTIGQPALGCEVGIFNPDTNEVVDCGEVGEIRCRSASTMLGYNDDPEATAAAVDGEGWLHTGDLGTMDDQGYVKITGRVKDMIIRGGENLFPAEIENVLLEHPSVAECAVVGVPDEVLGEAVAAFVRVDDGASFNPDALRAHCRSQISPQKCPAHWQQVTEWPLTGSGKIRKFKLRDRWVEEQAGQPRGG